MKLKNRNITLNTKLKFAEVISLLLVFAAAMCIGLVINSEVFAIVEVNQTSMLTTLEEGEKLYVNRFAYRFNEPRRGEIVIFLKGETINGLTGRFNVLIKDIADKITDNERDNRLVKRIIGLPGDIIEIKNGNVYIDYILLKEDYTLGTTYPMRFTGKVIVPEGMVFVMGDNREDSNDSRQFGFVDISSLEGKVIFRFWPFGRFSFFN